MHLLAAFSKRQGDQPSRSSSAASTTSSIFSRTSSSPSRTVVSVTQSAASRTSSSILSPTASPITSAVPDSQQKDTSKPTYIFVLAAVVGVFTALFFVFLILHRIRRNHENPKYIPTPFLKKLWQRWEPSHRNPKLARNNDHFEPISAAASRRMGPNAAAAGATASNSSLPGNNDGNGQGSGDIGTATVDRNTSVRSVMTLPAYRSSAHQNEQVLGREGERGGIDMVLEFPETQDDEERLREEEMEALYQIRLARRRENEERDERRRLRREARERGDSVALREISDRARASSTAAAGRSVEELRAEHERLKKERNRAVSSVAYGDLGVARHDGTRLRANSEDSERTGLLGDAASFAASGQYHRRDRSASSVLSLDTMNSDLPSPGMTRSRGNSRGSRADSPMRRVSTQEGASGNEGRAGSSPEMIEHEDTTPHSPPGYENISLDTPSSAATPQPPSSQYQEPPPDYTSPVLGRGESSSMIESQFVQVENPSTTSPGSNGRRKSSSRIERPISDRRTSGNDSGGSRGANLQTASADGEGRSNPSPGRGVGGVPQLPSLRLANLPSIQVDPGSPQVGRIEEERRSRS